MKYKNGDKYDGEWNDGKRQGKGVMTLVDRKIMDGKWANNNFQGEYKFKYQTSKT